MVRVVCGSLLALSALGACGSGSSSAQKPLVGQAALAAGDQLAHRVIPAPYGYTVDSTAGATGTIDADVFNQAGGIGSAAKVGFVVGFRQNYVDDSTSEGVTVTVLQFSSSKAATAYLKATAPKTLSFAAATKSAYPQIPGAFAFAGQKAYSGDYDHAIAMAGADYYALLVYANAYPGAAPTEINLWAKTQYLLLKVKTPPSSSG